MCPRSVWRDPGLAARPRLAYATLAAGGIYSKPMAIRKVVLGSGRGHRRRLGQARSGTR
jgi:membrane peptidoglycan carboxypeptidase